MTVAIFMHYYLNYLTIIDFKENKYRVTIKEILINSNDLTIRSSDFLEEYVTGSNNQNFKSAKIVNKALEYDHQHFLEKFSIKPQEKTSW